MKPFRPKFTGKPKWVQINNVIMTYINVHMLLTILNYYPKFKEKNR
jgi:hypothetical protein